MPVPDATTDATDRRRGVDDDAGKSLRQVGGAQRIAGAVRDRSS